MMEASDNNSSNNNNSESQLHERKVVNVLEQLHDALLSEIENLVAHGQHRCVTSDHYIKAHSRIRHLPMTQRMRFSATFSLDFGKMLDLKVVFDRVRYKNCTHSGFSECDFKHDIAPILCPTYPHGVNSWYNTIDYDANGFVDWAKLSLYLMSDFASTQDDPVAAVSAGTEGGGDASAASSPDEKSSSSNKDRQQQQAQQAQSESTGLSLTKPQDHDMQTYEYVPAPGGEFPSGHHVFSCAHNLSSDRYYGLLNDGIVRSFFPHSQLPDEIIHHRDENFANCLRLSPERNQLFVSHSNGLVLIYDVSGARSRTGNVFRALRIAPKSPANVHGEKIKKTVPYDPLKMAHHTLPAIAGNMSSKTRFIEIDICVSILDARTRCTCSAALRRLGHSCQCTKLDWSTSHQLTCVEPARGLVPNMLIANSKDPFFFAGFEGGVVAMYHVESQPTLPHTVVPAVQAWKPHTSFVTKIMATTTHSELYGLLSGSVDATLVLTDIEKNMNKLRLIDQKSSALSGGAGGTGGSAARGGDDGGWLDGLRPVTGFDVSSRLPLIASCSHMRCVNLWSAAAGQKVACFLDHKDAVVDVAFNDTFNQVISLGKDRTIRVYDLRMMRCVQTIVDKERQYSDEHLTALLVDGVRNTIVGFSGTPHVWQDKTAQQKNESGLKWASDYNGHLFSVQFCLVNDVTGHIVTADPGLVLVWNLKNMRIQSKFTVNSPQRCSCIAFDVSRKKLLIGYDSGNIDVVSHTSGSRIKVFKKIESSSSSSSDGSTISPHRRSNSPTTAIGASSSTSHKHNTNTNTTRNASISHNISRNSHHQQQQQQQQQGAAWLNQKSDEVTVIDYLPVSNDAGNDHPVCVVCDGGPSIRFYDDRPLVATVSSATIVPEVTIASKLDVLTHSTEHRHKGHITSVQVLTPTRMVVGTSAGDLLLIAFAVSAGPQCIACFHGPEGGLNLAHAAATTQQQRPSSPSQSALGERQRPASQLSERGMQIWRRVVDASKKERRLGSAPFTRFRHDSQTTMNQAVNQLIPLTSELVAALYGDGDCVIYKAALIVSSAAAVVAAGAGANRHQGGGASRRQSRAPTPRAGDSTSTPLNPTLFSSSNTDQQPTPTATPTAATSQQQQRLNTPTIVEPSAVMDGISCHSASSDSSLATTPTQSSLQANSINHQFNYTHIQSKQGSIRATKQNPS